MTDKLFESAQQLSSSGSAVMGRGLFGKLLIDDTCLAATPCAVPGQDNHDGYLALAADAPGWQNQITVESVGAFREFDAASALPLLAPTPLLLIAGERDALAPLETVRAGYARAGEPKALQVLPTTHFEVYREPWRSQAATAASEWFTQHF